MESTSGQQAFETTMGAIRDPWTPLAALRRTSAWSRVGSAGLNPRRRVTTSCRLGSPCSATTTAPRAARQHHVLVAVYVGMMGPVMGHTILEMDEPEHRATATWRSTAFRQKTLQRWETSSSGRSRTR